MTLTVERIWDAAWPILTVLAVFVMALLAPFLMFFLILWAISYFESTVTQQEETESAMYADKDRILDYIREHRVLPKSLSELPKPHDEIDATKDGWGRPIIYIIGKNDVVTLVSFGEDGKPSGSGDAADIIQSLKTKDAKGNWIQSPNFTNQSVPPFIRNWPK
jgi:hypothetical protein